jgi:rSAM/selenodomain-associated transferase 1
MRPTLYVVAKAPIMGRAKTRLAADIGPVHAKRIYRRLMAQVLRQVQDPRWDVVLAVTPPHLMGRVPDWNGFAQIPQVSGSLTPRLAALFARKGPTLTIGTDCPQVTATDIAAAFEALRSKPYVFGPASDGGFWLMGANGPLPRSFFDSVRWSHANTLSDVKSQTNGSYVELRTLTDVDDLKALRHLQQSQR